MHSSEFFQRLLRADFSLFLSFFGVKSSLFFSPIVLCCFPFLLLTLVFFQLSCLVKMVTLRGVPKDLDSYPKDLLLFLR